MVNFNLQKSSNWSLKRARRENKADKGWAIKRAVQYLTPFCPYALVSSPNLYPPTLSSAEAALCRREAGEKEKESARGTMGREKKVMPFSLFPLILACLQLFLSVSKSL